MIEQLSLLNQHLLSATQQPLLILPFLQSPRMIAPKFILLSLAAVASAAPFMTERDLNSTLWTPDHILKQDEVILYGEGRSKSPSYYPAHHHLTYHQWRLFTSASMRNFSSQRASPPSPLKSTKTGSTPAPRPLRPTTSKNVSPAAPQPRT